MHAAVKVFTRLDDRLEASKNLTTIEMDSNASPHTRYKHSRLTSFYVMEMFAQIARHDLLT